MSELPNSLLAQITGGKVTQDFISPVVKDNVILANKVNLPFCAAAGHEPQDEFEDRAARDAQLIKRFVANELQAAGLATAKEVEAALETLKLNFRTVKTCAFMRGYVEGLDEAKIVAVTDSLQRMCLDNLPGHGYLDRLRQQIFENETYDNAPQAKKTKKKEVTPTQLYFPTAKRSKGPLLVVIPDPQQKVLAATENIALQ